uniref:Glutathione peroxidase n=1 Tax=Leptocylindrus danicus TaxID=163516 RepID=A0A7S2PTG3_9STRA|mmetsp:Transcript_9614/g.14450  ORF Transcript_9614/g.14450 Transcript_9614/m.14450 type:complete len:122 (+) Transcript_9614:565-930(+)
MDTYGSRGLKVLAFPCNQFGKQEPGTNEEILKFSEKFGAREKFVWFTKGDVNGANAREVFTFLKDKIAFRDGTKGPVLWNFGKFLVDHEGTPFMRIGSKTAPSDPEVVEAIEQLLKAKEAK